MIDYLHLNVFFSQEDMHTIVKSIDRAGKQLVQNTNKMKLIFEFIVKTQWNKQLDGNKKLARKILDTLKMFENPEYK